MTISIFSYLVSFSISTKYLLPRIDDGLEYGENSSRLVSPKGRTCHIFVDDSFKKSIKFLEVSPKSPIPYLLGKAVGCIIRPADFLISKSNLSIELYSKIFN